MTETAAIILAAGKSTRMRSDLPKVLHEVCGRPMLSLVLGACRLAGVDRLVVVVGHGKELVKDTFSDQDDILFVEQTEQLGTGHAVQCCRAALEGFSGSVLVIAGDMPLIRRETLSDLLAVRMRSNAALTIATTQLDDPTGYGRIVRDENGAIEAIVEHRNCTDVQRGICEVNPSYYCFDAEKMFGALDQVEPDSTKGEYYVTDAVQILRDRGELVSAEVSLAAEDATGINSRLDLIRVNRLMQDRIQMSLIHEDVTIVDPDNTWIEADVTIGRESTIYPFSFIGAGAALGARCRVGPFAMVESGDTLADGIVVAPRHAVKEGPS